jgi:tripartite-type tricarboxylate transporter receptor subunit TctC
MDRNSSGSPDRLSAISGVSVRAWAENKMWQRLFCTVILVHAGCAIRIACVHADSYPDKPIRLILGFPAGVVDDYIARIIGPKVSASLGQNVIVDNRAGAAGNLAAEMVAHASPDGYTLLMVGSISLTSSRSLYSKLGYDLLKDFSHVAVVATSANVLIAHPSFPARSVAELVALARAQPKEIRYGSAGIASTGQLAMGLLQSRAGIELLHVPYKGAVAAVIGLAGGEVQVAFASTAAAMPMIAAKKVIALAATSTQPLAALPDVRTIAADYPGYNVISTFGILVPAGTPASVIKLLNAEFRKIAQMNDVKAKFAEQGIEAVGSTPAELKAILEGEVTMWGRVIREARITVN